MQYGAPATRHPARSTKDKPPAFEPPRTEGRILTLPPWNGVATSSSTRETSKNGDEDVASPSQRSQNKPQLQPQRLAPETRTGEDPIVSRDSLYPNGPMPGGAARASMIEQGDRAP